MPLKRVTSAKAGTESTSNAGIKSEASATIFAISRVTTIWLVPTLDVSRRAPCDLI